LAALFELLVLDLDEVGVVLVGFDAVAGVEELFGALDSGLSLAVCFVFVGGSGDFLAFGLGRFGDLALELPLTRFGFGLGAVVSPPFFFAFVLEWCLDLSDLS